MQLIENVVRYKVLKRHVNDKPLKFDSLLSGPCGIANIFPNPKNTSPMRDEL